MDIISKKQELIMVFLVLILFMILTFIFQNFSRGDKYKKIEYKTVTTENLLNDSEVNLDRSIYLSLEEIVVKYITSYTLPDNIDSKQLKKYITYAKYYDALTPEYKWNISKKNYIKKATVMLEKFAQISKESVNGEEPETIVNMVSTKPIDSVYKFDNNRYICKLKNINEPNKIAYIGIELSPGVKNKWSIFYLD